MTQNIQNLFKNLKNIEPSQGIEGKILKAIALEKSWQAKKKLIFADVLMIGSLGAFVFALLNWGSDLLKSEFWTILRLVFSDTASVAAFWKNFALSLLETFPAAHFAAILAPVLLLMISLSMYFAANNHNHYKRH